jgi:ankyrin repeat protein
VVLNFVADRNISREPNFASGMADPTGPPMAHEAEAADPHLSNANDTANNDTERVATEDPPFQTGISTGSPTEVENPITSANELVAHLPTSTPVEVAAATDSSGAEGAQATDKTQLNKALLDAALGGHDEYVATLLSKGADVSAKSDNGETAMHLVARYGYTDAAKALLKYGPDVNVRDDDGWTPLYGAADKSSTELIRLILAVPGVDISAQTKARRTPLYRASWYGRKEVAELLLDHEGGAATIDIADEDARTPLHAASSDGEIEVVKLLLRRNARTDLKDSNGRTALHLAIDERHHEVVKLLLDAKASIDLALTDFEERTALHGKYFWG